MPRILVVDDELGITEALEDVLSEEGYAVAIAHNGRAALEEIAHQRPDLLLLDFMMPVMDGGELLRHLRAEPSLREIPVVMMSAVPPGRIPLDVQPDHLLHKPFDIDEMLQVVQSKLTGASERV